MDQKVMVPVKKNREDQLQFLRFLAFLNVFFFHADMWNCFRYPAENGGHSAVTLFFLLSGMITGYTAWGREKKPTLASIGQEMWKRVKKLYPLYFATTFYFFLICGAWPLVLNRDLAGLMPYLKQMVRNMLMIQAWFPEGYYLINSVTWFCSAIFFLYLMNQPLSWLLNRINRQEKPVLKLTILFLGFLGFEVLYCYLLRNSDMGFWQYVFPVARVGEYGAAVVFGFLLKPLKQRLSQVRGMFWFTLAEAGSLVLWFVALLLPWNSWSVLTLAWLMPNFLVLGVFLLGKGYISKLFRWKPLVWLGDISFECYILHYALLSPFVKTLNSSLYGCVVSLGFYLLFTITVASVVRKK